MRHIVSDIQKLKLNLGSFKILFVSYILQNIYIYQKCYLRTQRRGKVKGALSMTPYYV